MKQQILTSFFEMKSRDSFKPKEGYQKRIKLKEVSNDHYLNFIFFAGVGLPWRWYSRINWKPADWKEHFMKNPVQTWLAFAGESLVGYIEIEHQEKANCEIKFVGLLPHYLGEGLGGYLISHAVDKAWDSDAKRVWLHTCNKDHPNAIKVYLKSGFKLYDEVLTEENLPNEEEFLESIQDYYRSYMFDNE